MRRALLLFALVLLTLPARAGATQQLGFFGSSCLPLDCLATSPVAAYSTHRWKGTYAGNALKLRRASDNATQDIGFVGNEFDTASATTFCAATTCFVTTLYDQVGARNLTQATAANQPQLLFSATPSGKPSMGFAKASSQMLTNTVTTLTMAVPYTQFVSYKRTGDFTSLGVLSGDDNGRCLCGQNLANTVVLFSGASLTATAADSAWHAVSSIANGVPSSVIVDGNAAVTGNAGTTSYSSMIRIGNSSTTSPTASIASVILFNVAVSASDQASMISAERAWGGW